MTPTISLNPLIFLVVLGAIFWANWKIGLGILVVCLVIGLGLLGMAHPLSIDRDFAIDWDSSSTSNQGWKVEQHHAAEDGHFVIHVPDDVKDVGITPEITVLIKEKTWPFLQRRTQWSASLPLVWDGTRLDVELPGKPPSISDTLVGGRMTWTHEVEQINPNRLMIRYHLQYTRGTKHHDVPLSITVESHETPHASR